MESLLNKLLGEKKKSCIVKQHYINIGGFATQLEAYRLAEKIHKCLEVPEERISVNESYLEVSQSEDERHNEGRVKSDNDKSQNAFSEHGRNKKHR